MSQDLFTNPFGIPPPSDDSDASLSRFIAEFSQAIPQDQFDSFRSKLTSLYEAVASKLRGETRPQDDMSEIRGMLQALYQKVNNLEEGQSSLREDMIQGQNSLREDMIQGQNSLREVMIQGQRRLEGQLGSVNNNVQVNKGDAYLQCSEIDSKVNKTRSSAQRSENIINRFVAKDTKPIPFVNGQEPPAELPELKTISDVDNLNPQQLKTYAEGYGFKYDENEPQKSLKRKIADYAGFVTHQDILYELSDSNESLRDVGNQNSAPNQRAGTRRPRHH
ncbi:hypothetical protein SPOG_05736 [Schizosaccharomyces cryophilus OY26]|uniref:Mug135-like C-terminal domain-containing protein n=1 Tax=Schizosaccharomyces cryophilus (strain OY26 / ATCC MYA-4695 / CBS 11777 / NBRC 106824 / NRRL Y48691) TaxID=653667 RepID=S9VX46_SCHCR|nr:uncharacterized protein SPOG_05736 [Schizosaccharomyces cryophilus OY26]EPY52243.1 hypothetical protein SPOG_05736 [Schizosaccharomyces cryophilus OY26]